MTRLLAALALLLALAAPVAAMQKRTSNVTDQTGRVIATATVTVYIAGTATPATIYSDNGVNLQVNPIVVNPTDGSYTYYAANGRYTEVITASGYTFAGAQSTDLTLFDQAEGITLPDPVVKNPGIVWSNSTFGPAIMGNSAGTGLTMSVLQSELVFSLLRRDIAAGNQTAADINFEMPNSVGNAYRIGFIRGKQTGNTAGSEQGYIDVETINAGANTEWARFGADAGGGIGVWAVTGLGSNQFLALNGAVAAGLYNNAASGFVGTLTSHSFRLRTNNTDAITIDNAQNVTMASLLSLTGIAFAGLGTPGNGGIRFCTDCDPASNPCTSAGAKTGSFAFRMNGAWKCL